METLDKSTIPYLIITRTIEFGFSVEHIKICICLVDPLCTGAGLNRDEAIKSMVEKLDAKYNDEGGIK